MDVNKLQPEAAHIARTTSESTSGRWETYEHGKVGCMDILGSRCILSLSFSFCILAFGWHWCWVGCLNGSWEHT
ncbi:hypothetical protein VTJ04DRAFT_1260 [Mycothermus thermophilus]|uniref:uncharacterized protein n=1 Tax=Humicola insolens TaxID=85995 RepID=UPI00374452D6